MKYVLYEGKAYQVYESFDDGVSVLLRPDDRTEKHLTKKAYTEITEAEYHARKLLEAGIPESFKYASPFGCDIGDLINHFDRERKPKPEVTEAHIGCLVEFLWSDIDPTLDIADRANCNDDSTRLPRQPVPLAFHKHDGGERPEWVKGCDFVVCWYNNAPSSSSNAALIEWKGVDCFAVIKPVLPEGE